MSVRVRHFLLEIVLFVGRVPSRFAWSLTPPEARVPPPAAQARPLKGGASVHIWPSIFPVRPSVRSFVRSFAASRNCARDKSDGKVFPAFGPLARGIVRMPLSPPKCNSFRHPDRQFVRKSGLKFRKAFSHHHRARFQGWRDRWLTNCFLPPTTRRALTQTTGPQGNPPAFP